MVTMHHSHSEHINYKSKSSSLNLSAKNLPAQCKFAGDSSRRDSSEMTGNSRPRAE